VTDPYLPPVEPPDAPAPPRRKAGNGRLSKRSAFDEGSLDQYLRDISAYPLITREDEVELAGRIRTGDEEALDKLVRSSRSRRSTRTRVCRSRT
jgi:Sigma-70 factor, region 1.2